MCGGTLVVIRSVRAEVHISFHCSHGTLAFTVVSRQCPSTPPSHPS